MQRDAGDVSADCFVSPEISFTCESNKERIRFNQLVNQYTHELQTITQKKTTNNQPRLDLLEVFCGPQSQLTHQSQRLGYRAERRTFSKVIYRPVPAVRPCFPSWFSNVPRMFGFRHHVALGVVSHA